MSDDQLKPCPCGGIVYTGEYLFDAETQWSAGCLDCGRSSGKHADEASAIAAWNRRAPVSNWQPIETAPSGNVLLYYPAKQNRSGNVLPERIVVGCAGGTSRKPTHWIPLPNPPGNTA